MAPSSSGLGRRPLTAETWVQLPVGLPRPRGVAGARRPVEPEGGVQFPAGPPTRPRWQVARPSA
jgi:hypothetical protein